MVDCCIDAPESRAQWQQIFDTQLQGMPILRVIVAHMQPDQVGLAHWLCELDPHQMTFSVGEAVARLNIAALIANAESNRL